MSFKNVVVFVQILTYLLLSRPLGKIVVSQWCWSCQYEWPISDENHSLSTNSKIVGCVWHLTCDFWKMYDWWDCCQLIVLYLSLEWPISVENHSLPTNSKIVGGVWYLSVWHVTSERRRKDSNERLSVNLSFLVLSRQFFSLEKKIKKMETEAHKCCLCEQHSSAWSFYALFYLCRGCGMETKTPAATDRTSTSPSSPGRGQNYEW